MCDRFFLHRRGGHVHAVHSLGVQVERKRHLGNDVVVIVFRESDCTEPFDPLKIKSQFNRT